MAPKPTILMILDGWGINPDTKGNAVAASGTPFLKHLQDTYPHTQLRCSGEDVGLPAGIMGNSEVGHLNIGAGRIVYQDLLRIDRAIEDGQFFENDVLLGLLNRLRESGAALHLMGLVSDGGVHSQLTHLLALLDMARTCGVTTAVVHAITDGRDTAPHSGEGFVGRVQEHLSAEGYGTIGTVCGRYYAMDRDKRWERTEKAYVLYTQGVGRAESDPVAAVRGAYDRGETDEFITPVSLNGYSGIADGDGIIFFNFRADRARQMTRALTVPHFDAFQRQTRPSLAGYVTMTLYDETFDSAHGVSPGAPG